MTLVTISSKNQITVPVWILNEFKIKSGGKFLMGRQNDKIVLEPLKGSLVDEIAGSLSGLIPADKRNVPWETALRQAKIAKAKKVANDS